MQLLTDMGIIHNTYVRMYIGNNKNMLGTYLYVLKFERTGKSLFIHVKFYIITGKVVHYCT